MSEEQKFIIEIATTDFITTRNAIRGGADRIELCMALTEGGITPSFGLVKKCRETFDAPLFPIIRPRPGDFLFKEDEFDIMLHDVQLFKELGCDGVVIGLLHKNGTIDLSRTAKLIALAYPMEVTFHRAFDRCVDPLTALEELIAIGCQRILTSGQKPTAPEGIELIAQLIKQADGRIIIMPGSGVRKENIKALKEQSGAVEFHSSLRGKRNSKMDFIHPAFAGSDESYTNPYIDESEVQALRNALNT